MDLPAARHEAGDAAVADVSDVAQQVGRQEVVGRRLRILVQDVILHRQLTHLVRQHPDHRQDVVVVHAVDVVVVVLG